MILPSELKIIRTDIPGTLEGILVDIKDTGLDFWKKTDEKINELRSFIEDDNHYDLDYEISFEDKGTCCGRTKVSRDKYVSFSSELKHMFEIGFSSVHHGSAEIDEKLKRQMSYILNNCALNDDSILFEMIKRNDVVGLKGKRLN